MSFILNSGRFGGGADPGLTLLQSATLWLDASDMASGAQWLRNKGTGGRALDARVGSVGSAQIINGAFKTNGAANNCAHAPDHASMTTTAIEIVMRVSPTSWAGNPCFASKRLSGNEWQVDCFGNAIRFLAWIGGGSNTRSVSISGILTGSTTYWIKITADASATTFYYAADQATEPSSWTTIGTAQAALTGWDNTASRVQIGAEPFSAADPVTVYRAIVRASIGGASVLDADFTAQSTLATSFTESSSNAATVTINSTTGVDTNDPLLLTHTGTNYLYLPGSAGNNATTPDASALDITGDIEIVVRVALEDWTPSAINMLVSKESSNVTRAYQFYVETSGALTWASSPDGLSYTQTVTSSVPSFTNGTAYWLRVRRTSSSGAVTFEWAADAASEPSSWTSLTGGTGTSGAIANSAGQLGIGFNSAGFPLAGSIYRVIIRNGIAGTIAFDANFTANTNQSSFTESSSNAATVTINRVTSGRKAVMVVRPTLLFGTDDYLEVADNDLLDFGASDSFTAIVVQRAWNTIPSVATWLAKRTNSGSSGVGWGVFSNGATLDVLGVLADGTTASTDGTGATWSAGARNIVGIERSVSAGRLYSVLNSTLSTGTTDATTGTLNGAVVFRVGRDTASTSPGAYLDGEIEHVAVFRSALTSTELGQIATYLGVS